jgi:hypothetical protein
VVLAGRSAFQVRHEVWPFGHECFRNRRPIYRGVL